LSDERIWGAFLAELEWLHVQMNRGLRETFAPLFALFEIKTIVLCLRNKAAERTAEVTRLLDRSLLCQEVRNTLRGNAGVRATIAAAFPDLENAYVEGNLQEFENALMRAYLQDTITKRLDPLLRDFFARFIDLRNVVLLYKDLRWKVTERSPFVSGGSVDPSRLTEIAATGDTAALDRLVQSITGLDTISVATAEGALETVLLRTMTHHLARMRRTADAVALIAGYVWRIYVQARNLAVLHHAADLDPATLEREMVL
jgi:vacuolar-type H+-ATPase subunit C/Vma6